jgi:ATP-dependent DNA helicase RecG
MQYFARGQIHILIATTVIEVGMDVPNASVWLLKVPSGSDYHNCISYVAG